MISRAQQNQLRQKFFNLSLLTLITVILWVAAVTYQALTKTQVTPQQQQAVSPLTPSLDTDTIEKIKQRQQIPPEDWGNLVKDEQ